VGRPLHGLQRPKGPVTKINYSVAHDGSKTCFSIIHNPLQSRLSIAFGGWKASRFGDRGIISFSLAWALLQSFSNISYLTVFRFTQEEIKEIGKGVHGQSRLTSRYHPNHEVEKDGHVNLAMSLCGHLCLLLFLGGKGWLFGCELRWDCNRNWQRCPRPRRFRYHP